jgi:hypothetical protein
MDVGSSEIWILGQLEDELQALESKYPTIQHPSFSSISKLFIPRYIGLLRMVLHSTTPNSEFPLLDGTESGKRKRKLKLK